ncbi:chromosomal replication initiator protein DnaA [Ferrigenium kumadai]|uniref:Chromosomal replication initiator protein DnaA n=1 Tax=Ferrigenium kumadai TaxID=1682490 RepID=A0AAN1SWY7_9PROT|nr:chromosomal replication initiator protein DnaA [Ferrigenium kumadai]BBI98308.1 chromosomal replication initiator protein DnaA [Ferrigenium kumadai]
MQDISFWDTCLRSFEKSLPPQQYNSWIKPLVLKSENGSLILTAPNSFTLKLVQERFMPEINRQASLAYSHVPPFEFRIIESDPANKPQEAATPKKVAPPTTVDSKPKSESSFRGYGKLNPSLTFDNFVTGKANQLAFAAATQVAELPGASYNPLFIYGGVGLGKTHLVQAIGNQVRANNPQAKICYMHAERYVSDVVRAYQSNKFEEFKQYYHSLDILLIDDIQFFAGKAKTQEEFFYAFNTLIDSHKQVILTSDTFPKEISGLESRLVSRFGWGLTVAIEPPELEMRVAILLKKASLGGYVLDEAVAFFIAKHVNSNVRELEGALKRVEAYAKFHRRAITVETAKEALKDILIAQSRQISIENIQKTVADYYRIKLVDMLSKKRTRNLTRPRQMAMSLAREITSMSLPEIGHAFGGKDHSTVIHACKTVESLKAEDTTIDADYKILLQTLRG